MVLREDSGYEFLVMVAVGGGLPLKTYGITIWLE